MLRAAVHDREALGAKSQYISCGDLNGRCLSACPLTAVCWLFSFRLDHRGQVPWSLPFPHGGERGTAKPRPLPPPISWLNYAGRLMNSRERAHGIPCGHASDEHVSETGRDLAGRASGGGAGGLSRAGLDQRSLRAHRVSHAPAPGVRPHIPQLM